MNSIAAGTAVSIPYTFSTTITDADPGAGILRLSNATQNAATVIRADIAGSDGSTWTSVLDLMDDSTSTVKGLIMLQALADGTKWLMFSVSALASPTGYKNITVANVASSAANPFSNGESLVLKFTRNGDKGDAGAAASAGSFVYLSTVSASAASTVDIETGFSSTYDDYLIIATGIQSASAGGQIRARMKIGGSYLSAGYDYVHTISRNDTPTGANQGGANQAQAVIAFEIGTTEGLGFDLRVHDINNASRIKQIVFSGTSSRSSGAILTYCAGGASNRTAGVLSGIRITSTGGTMTGDFKLYGISN
jgi:hypothetical protein